MVVSAGIEPAPQEVSVLCSTIELYPYINLEQITGIEPALPAWEAGVLTIERYLHLVLPKRLELLRT